MPRYWTEGSFDGTTTSDGWRVVNDHRNQLSWAEKIDGNGKVLASVNSDGATHASDIFDAIAFAEIEEADSAQSRALGRVA